MQGSNCVMNIARRWQIYAIFDPETGRPIYVGRTYGDPIGRFTQHFRSPKHCTLSDLLRGWTLKGLTPHVEILDKGNGDCTGAERAWIARLRSWGYDLLNRSAGGEPTVLLPSTLQHSRVTGPRQGMMLRRMYDEGVQSHRTGFKRARAFDRRDRKFKRRLCGSRDNRRPARFGGGGGLAHVLNNC